MTKLCTKCKELKDFLSFCKDRTRPDGLCIWCRTCKSEADKKGYNKYKERRLLLCKHWTENNREKHRKYRSTSYQNNLERNRETAKEYSQKRNKTVQGNLYNRVSSGIRKSLKEKNGRSWTQLVNYSYEDLQYRLEKTIPSNSSWTDFFRASSDPKQLVIDHIIPHSLWKFKFETDIGFKMCWDLENLRAILRKDNCIKHNKLTSESLNVLSILYKKYNVDPTRYLRPVKDWNVGKREEFSFRKEYIFSSGKKLVYVDDTETKEELRSTT